MQKIKEEETLFYFGENRTSDCKQLAIQKDRWYKYTNYGLFHV